MSEAEAGGVAHRPDPEGEREKAAFLARLRAYEGQGEAARPGRDPVNEAMIRHWCEALGDANPVYTDAEAAARSVHGGVVAPPTMLQVWTMRGLSRPPSRSASPIGELYGLLDEAGFRGVVATDCEQEYIRELRPGDRITCETRVESVSEEKRTALGPGHFVTTRMEVRDAAGALVGVQRFRLLKFRPRSQGGSGAGRP